MSRLFISGKEIDLINDIRKEIYKDVGMHKVYYYKISYENTSMNEVDGESDEKVYEQPLILDALVKFIPSETKTTSFGVDKKHRLEFFISNQDMIDREIDILPGSFCEYGNIFYEITKVTPANYLFGMVEYYTDLKVEGVQARDTVFKTKLNGPRTPLGVGDSGAIQQNVTQQSGFDRNAEGFTDDSRSLIDKGILEPKQNGPQTTGNNTEYTNSIVAPKPTTKHKSNNPIDDW